MTNKKMRLRVARIAASVVIAAGASLTAAGAAQAVGIGIDLGPVNVQANVHVPGESTPPAGGDETTPGGGDETTPGGGDETTPPGDETTPPGDETTPPGDETTPPGDETTPPGHETTPPGHETTSPGTNPSDHSSDNAGTCTIEGDNVNCDDNNTGTDNAGSPQQVTGQAPKEELAETGSSETVLLIIGAATMIAGGVAFRFMPNLVNRNGAAA